MLYNKSSDEGIYTTCFSSVVKVVTADGTRHKSLLNPRHTQSPFYSTDTNVLTRNGPVTRWIYYKTIDEKINV